MAKSYSTLIDLGVVGDQAVTAYYSITKARRATYLEPGEPETVSILSVTWDGHEILHYLPDYKIDDIKSEISESASEEAACAAEMRADAIREERLFKDAA